MMQKGLPPWLWRNTTYHPALAIAPPFCILAITMLIREAITKYRTVGKLATAKRSLDSVALAVDYLREFFATLSPDVEQLAVVLLNNRNRAICCQVVTVGTATASLAHPREIYRLAIAQNATSIILAHNHPSGDPCPSAADHNVTRQVRQAGEVLGISLTDHIVIGEVEYDPTGKGYYSFRESGLV